MTDKATTKERIIEEALTLFAAKGYEGTSVKNIADAVGIKDSSLYKHYKSKKDIFDTIVLEMSKRMEQMSQSYGLPDEKDMESAAALYGEMTEDAIFALSRQIFLFYLKDEFAAKFRRMLTIEQYRDYELYTVYRQIFMEASITYQSVLFEEMSRRGIFRKEDPEVMALHFFGPLFFLLNKYDQEPEKESQAIRDLERHVRGFARLYRATDGS